MPICESGELYEIGLTGNQRLGAKLQATRNYQMDNISLGTFYQYSMFQDHQPEKCGQFCRVDLAVDLNVIGQSLTL